MDGMAYVSGGLPGCCCGVRDLGVSAVKMKPIIFSGPMVRAILDGNKTQTRRVVKRQPGYCHWESFKSYELLRELFLFDDGTHLRLQHRHSEGGRIVSDDAIWNKSRYQVGDILYVKETFQFFPGETDQVDEIVIPLTNDVYVYRADVDESEWSEFNWKPSIYMPRDAARIFLKVTNVRVERLQDISEHDAWDEGVHDLAAENEHWDGDPDEYRKNFRELWDSINGDKHPWESNKWVWVYEFERFDHVDGQQTSDQPVEETH